MPSHTDLATPMPLADTCQNLPGRTGISGRFGATDTDCRCLERASERQNGHETRDLRLLPSEQIISSHNHAGSGCSESARWLGRVATRRGASCSVCSLRRLARHGELSRYHRLRLCVQSRVVRACCSVLTDPAPLRVIRLSAKLISY